jgi:hypothetical protein
MQKKADQPLPDVRSLTIDASCGHLGVTLENTENGTGVRILELHAADLMAQAGLKTGDVLLSIESKSLKDHEQAFSAIGSATGQILHIEYWTEAEAAAAAAIQGPSRGRSRLMAFTLLAVVLVAGACGFAYFTLQHQKEAGSYAAATTQPPISAPSAVPKPLGTTKPKKPKAAEIMGDMWSGSLEDYEEKLETLTRAQIVKELKKKSPEWVDKGLSVDDLRDKLVEQAETARRMVKEYKEKATDDGKQKKALKQLKLRNDDQLRELLQDVDVPCPDGARTKDLREIALRCELRGHATNRCARWR